VLVAVVVLAAVRMGLSTCPVQREQQQQATAVVVVVAVVVLPRRSQHSTAMTEQLLKLLCHCW
jgi:hypothetical protein